MCATLAPRMNVENGFKLFRHNGAGPVVHHEVEQAFDAMWRPAGAGVYPNRGPSPKREREAAGAPGKAGGGSVPTAVKAAAYRAPGSSGSSAVADIMRGGPDPNKVRHCLSDMMCVYASASASASASLSLSLSLSLSDTHTHTHTNTLSLSHLSLYTSCCSRS
jgi:hypothetical protein